MIQPNIVTAQGLGDTETIQSTSFLGRQHTFEEYIDDTGNFFTCANTEKK